MKEKSYSTHRQFWKYFPGWKSDRTKRHTANVPQNERPAFSGNLAMQHFHTVLVPGR